MTEQVGASSRPYWPVALAAVYDSIGYGVVGPVLPALAEKADATSLAASVVFAAFSIGMVVGFLASASTARRRGPRLVLVAGVSLHLAADVLFVVGDTAAMYASARLVQGAGSGGLWLGAILMTLAWWPEGVGRRIGIVLSGYAAGSVVGPLLAGLGGTVRPFLADAALAVVTLAALTRLRGGHGRRLGRSRAALRDPRLPFASAVVLCSALLYAIVEGSYTLLFAERLSQGGLGALVAVLTLGGGAGALLPFATRDPATARTISAACVLACAALLLPVAAIDSPVAWFLLLPAAGLSIGAGEAAALGLLATVPEEGLISVMMANAQAWALGFLVGPPLATWLAGSAGRTAPGFALVAAAALAAVLSRRVPAGSPSSAAPTAARGTGP